jgi:hypothetical protein
MTDERNFNAERLVARITELRQQYDDGKFDYETFKLETTKVLAALDDTPSRTTAQQLLGALGALAKFK